MDEPLFMKLPLDWRKANAEVTLLDKGSFNHPTHLVKVNDRYYVMKTFTSEKDFFIDRDIEDENIHRLAQLGLAPRVQWTDRRKGLQFLEFVPGRITNKEDLENERLLFKILRAIISVHSTRSGIASELNPFRTIKTYAKEARRINFSRMENPEVERIQRQVRQIEKRILRFQRPRTICHNDLTPGNIIISPSGTVQIIDWEFAAMGDPLFDFANFLSNLRDGSEKYLDDERERKVLDWYLMNGEGQDIVYHYILVARYLGVLWSMILEKRSETSFNFVEYTNTLVRLCVDDMDSAKS